MPQRILAPDGGFVEFPDGMGDDQIAAVMRREYGGPELRNDQYQGFQKGVAKVGANLAPLLTVLGNPSVGWAMRVRRTLQPQIDAAMAAQGKQPGQAGEQLGTFVASAPTMFMGGPATSGAISGYATSDAEDPLGKMKDAAVGALGGKILGGVVGKVADTVAPVIRPAVARLNRAGVRLTPGQIRGGKAMLREDKAMSRPGVGEDILSGRIASLEDANRAFADQVLEPLQQSLPRGVRAGVEAIDHAHKAVSKAYEAVVPKLSVKPDPRFVAGLRRVYQDVTKLPDAQQAQFNSILKSVRFGQGGVLSGRQLQSALSDLGRLRRAYGGSAVASERELGQTLSGLRDELMGMTMRQNPSHAPALQAADAAFRRLAIVENAASKADEGIASTAQMRQAVRQADPSRRKAAMARGKAPMQDFVRDVREVTPGRTPSSGTADRQMAASLPARISGQAARAGYAADRALTDFLAKHPQIAAAVRRGILSAQRPAGFLGATTFPTLLD